MLNVLKIFAGIKQTEQIKHYVRPLLGPFTDLSSSSLFHRQLLPVKFRLTACIALEEK